MQYDITVFTPTYNRGYIINNLYLSLKSQTFKNFEWIIIDDGSTDNTKELFESWKNENNFFTIRYFFTKNGGKHRAINKGVDLAKGNLFFIVDSDDYITDDALEKIIKWESTIENKHEFAGVSGNRGYNTKEIIGATFVGDYIDATSLERGKYNISGDKSEVFYTHILKKHKFPEFERENFVTENVVWYEIANNGYKIRWFNEIIYICDYLEDGLTKSGEKIFINNPKGYLYYIKQLLTFKEIKLSDKIKSIAGVIKRQSRMGLSCRQSAKMINVNIAIYYMILFMVKIYCLIKNGKEQP